MTEFRGIYAELDKSERRILIEMPYSAGDTRAIKAVPGSSWRKKSAVWSVPAELETGRLLRRLYGSRLVVGPRMLAWGKLEATRSRNLSKISTADDYPLEQMRTLDLLPKLAESLWPHQRADAVFMSKTSCINANEQGTGKTRDVLAAVYEGEREHMPQLILSPTKAIEATWAAELEQFITVPVLAHEELKDRVKDVVEAWRLYEAGEPFWLVINKDMVRFEAEYEMRYSEAKGKKVRIETNVYDKYPELFEILWGTVTVDEFHKVGLSNLKTLGARAIASLEHERLYFMSGTPMGGKETNLFGPLRLLDSKNFTNKSRWENTWLDTEVDWAGFRRVGGIKKGKEQDFYRHLAPYMVRRLKLEVFPDLPPKEYEDVWCKMTPRQRIQYESFARDAEVKIEEHHLNATNALAEYARLRFFATALCRVEGKDVPCKECEGTGEVRGYECYECIGTGTIEKLKLFPTEDSGKLPYLMAKLEEFGVEPGQHELKALIGSQHRETVNMVSRCLEEKGYIVKTILGGSKEPTRDIVSSFQSTKKGTPQLVVATYGAGGVSLTLDRADSVHLLDETYIPDEPEQFEDRAHRGSRIHRVRCCYYRSRNTVDEDIKELNDEKGFRNWNILDLRRKMMKREEQ